MKARLVTLLAACLALVGALVGSASAATPTSVLVIGDSISAGCPGAYCSVPVGSRWVDRAQVYWGAQQPATVDTLAVNGTTSAYWDGNPAVRAHAAGKARVVIELGMNDYGTCADPFWSAVHQYDIVRQVHAVNPGATVALLHLYQPLVPRCRPWSDYGYWQSVAAANSGARFLDVGADFAGRVSTLLMADGIHPTIAGHDQLARSVVSRFPVG